MRERGTELKTRFGAHSIGIGRKRVGGRPTDTLALIFYVERKGSASNAVPASLAFTPSGYGGVVELPTDVVQAPPFEPESERAPTNRRRR